MQFSHAFGLSLINRAPSNNVAEVFHRLGEDRTLIDLQRDASLMKGLNNNICVFFVIVFRRWEDDDVCYVDKKLTPVTASLDDIQVFLKRSRSISEPE